MRLRTTEAAEAPPVLRPAPLETCREPLAEARPAPARTRAPKSGRSGRLNGSEKLLLWLGFGLSGLGLLAGVGFTAFDRGAWLDRGVTEPPLVRPAPPADNAYPAFVAAGRMAVEAKGARKNVVIPPIAEAKALVAANAPALATLRKAFGKPYVPTQPYTFDALYPEYADYRKLARALAVESAVRSDAGNVAGAAESLLDAIELGVTVPQNSLLIGRLVGNACEAIGQTGLTPLANQLTAAAARAAARRLEGLDARRLPFADTIHTEGIATHEALRSLLAHHSPRETLQLLGSSELRLTLTQMLLISRQTILDHHRLRMEFQARRATLAWNDPRRTAAYSGPTDPINEMLDIAANGAALRDRLARTRSALLTARLALHAYRLERGVWPKSLDQLAAARILRGVPRDGFTEGSPLQYSLRNGKPVVYSIGPDARDDGGTPAAPSGAAENSFTEATRGDLVDYITSK